MEKTKKFDIESIIILSILAVSLIMGIVGICIPWVLETVKVSETAKRQVINTVTIDDYFKKELMGTSGFWTMFSLAIATISANAVVIGIYILSRFIKTEKFIPLWSACILLSCVLIICSVLALCFTQFHIKEVYSSDAVGYLGLAGAGAWLLSVFGVIGGIAGVLAFCRLAFRDFNKI